MVKTGRLFGLSADHGAVFDDYRGSLGFSGRELPDCEARQTDERANNDVKDIFFVG